jgi:hypothetical protein
MILQSNKYFSFNKRVFPVHAIMSPSKNEIKLRKLLFNRVPVKLLEFQANLPKVGNPAVLEKVKQLKTVYQKVDDTLGIFEFFMEGDWHFVNKRIY